jgi:hypothetical protein
MTPQVVVDGFIFGSATPEHKRATLEHDPQT